MNPLLRIALIIGSIVITTIIAKKIKKSKIRISDSIFWIMFAVLLVAIALFPHLARAGANFFGFKATSNFVFSFVIGVLLLKQFYMAQDISLLRHRVEELTQEMALAENKHAQHVTETEND